MTPLTRAPDDRRRPAGHRAPRRLAALVLGCSALGGCSSSVASPAQPPPGWAPSVTSPTDPAASATPAGPPPDAAAAAGTPGPAYLQPDVPAPDEPVTPAPTSRQPVDAVNDLPGPARERTPAGRAAFARHFYQTVGRIKMAPSLGQIERLCTPTFEYCHDRERMAREFRDAGLHVDVPQLSVDAALATPGKETRLKEGDLPVMVGLTEHATRQLDDTGSDVAPWTTGPRHVTIVLGCVWDGRRWLADSFFVVDGGRAG